MKTIQIHDETGKTLLKHKTESSPDQYVLMEALKAVYSTWEDSDKPEMLYVIKIFFKETLYWQSLPLDPEKALEIALFPYNMPPILSFQSITDTSALTHLVE